MGKSAGGLARRATWKKSIQADAKHVLLLDNGNACPATGTDKKARTDTVLKAMEAMGYTAMNAGLNEICCPQSLLNRDLPSFPVITSNLVRKETLKPAGKPFIIKNSGSIRLGIMGILPADALSGMAGSSYIDKYTILSPEKSINRYLPVLKQKADIIILLSQCDIETTRHLIQDSKGISIAIVPGDVRLPAGSENSVPANGCKDSNTQMLSGRIPSDSPIILATGDKGESIGYLKLNFSKNSGIIRYQNRVTTLDASVPGDPVIKGLVDSFLHNPGRVIKLRTLQKNMDEIKSLQQLTPEEYIKTLSQ